MTTKDTIREWFLEGVKLGASHLIVVVDTFDHEDYPVYIKVVSANEPESNTDRVTKVHDARKFVAENYSGQNMQRTMEVYKLSAPIESQLNTGRNFRY